MASAPVSPAASRSLGVAAVSMETILITAVGGLVSAIVFLFAQFRTSYAAMEKRLSENQSSVEKRLTECETDRRSLWERMTRLEAYGCADTACRDRQPNLSMIALPRTGPGPGGPGGRAP